MEKVVRLNVGTRVRRSAAVGVVVVLAMGGLSGCGMFGGKKQGVAKSADGAAAVAKKSGTETSVQVPVTGWSEIWAVAGEPTPVSLSGIGAVVKSGQKSVKVDGHDAPIWWVGSKEVGGRDGWMGVTREWSANAAEGAAVRSEDGGATPWVLLAGRTGEEGAGAGGRVQIGDRAVTVRVVEVMDAAAARPGAVVPEQQRPLLGELLEPASRSPFAAWRAEMALGQTEGDEGVEVGAGELVKQINVSEAALWRTALARCSAIDAALGAAVARRVRGVVEIDGSHAVPVWVQDSESLRQLRSDLLADDLSDAARKTRVRAWLEAQPPAAAWVSDDAGLRDALSGAPICEVVFVNLGDAPVAASAVLERGGVTPSGPEMVTVEPWRAARLHAAAAVGQSDRERAVIVRAGGWTKRLPVLCKDLAARPPGLQVGPLMLELSNRLMKGASEAGVGVLPVAELPQGDRMTAGMLMREADRPGVERASGEKQRESWTVYFECMHPAASATGEEDDRLHVWFGPSGPAGKGSEVMVNRSGKDSSPGVRVVRQQDRWLCWVPVPAAAIESDQHLRLGVTRENGGIRTAWPRPLLPWETQPGRVCVDLSEWSKRGQAGMTEGGGAR